MSTEHPTQEQIQKRISNDFFKNLKVTTALLPQTLVGALTIALAGASDELHTHIDLLYDELFLVSATLVESIDRLAKVVNVTRNIATAGRGFITINGSEGAVIPIGTIFRNSDNIEYESLAESTIALNTLSIISLTRTGSTVTAQTDGEHRLASNISVEISGANETEFNGAFNITVTADDEFEYTVSGAPATPATGTIIATGLYGEVELQATSYGAETNLPSGAPVNLVNPIAGIQNTGYVQDSEIGGGADLESKESYRDRTLEAYRRPASPFSADAIEQTALSVSGVTRAFVLETTPEVGDVTIYFLRDDDDDIIPTAPEIQAVKDKIVNEIKPAHMSEDLIYVLAPTEVPVDFTFSSIEPSTSSMKEAVTANINAFFREAVSLGQDIERNAYESAIYNTIDTQTGERVQSFSLATPTSTISINSGEIATAGNISI